MRSWTDIADAEAGSSVRTKLNTLGKQAIAGHPGYVSGRWYYPFDQIAVGGNAPGADSMRLIPFVIHERIAVTEIGLRVTTSNAGNVQGAIYAASASTGLPTGSALVSTASMTTASTGVVSDDVTDTTLNPGMYWWALLCDNAVAAFTALANTTALMGPFIGSTTLATVISAASTTSYHYSFAHTFGTWPDLSAASLTESTGPAFGVFAFKAGTPA